MIQIICKSESYTYNAYHILKAFYPSQEVSCKTDEKASNYVMVHLPDDREISVGFENTVEITDTAGRDESTGKIQDNLSVVNTLLKYLILNFLKFYHSNSLSSLT